MESDIVLKNQRKLVSSKRKTNKDLKLAKTLDINADNIGINKTKKNMSSGHRCTMCPYKQFILNVSHELRTPIAISKAYTEAILSGDIDENNKLNSLSVILNNLERLNGIISNLLLLSRLEQNLDANNYEFKVVNLCSTIQGAINTCQLYARKKNIDIIFKRTRRLQASINEILLHQALVNLIVNAIYYSNDGSDIEIFLKNNKTDISISVKDFGIGIEKKHLGNIFNKFYYIDKGKTRQFLSTGLGLSIVKLVAELHQGRVTVKSYENKGSTFTLHIPCSRSGL